jgi:methylated-DNA-protein-cysteine methyltransferase-like protein
MAVVCLNVTSRGAPKKKNFAALFRPLSLEGSRSRRGPAGEDNPALEAIWHVVASIPRGKVSTYGAVARAAGLPGRARQTGFALRVAPEELNLPWHRVLGAGGRIVFPKTSRSHKEQARRLRAEGVPVKDGRVDAAAVAQLEEL